jgi:hypothetical protein
MYLHSAVKIASLLALLPLALALPNASNSNSEKRTEAVEENVTFTVPEGVNLLSFKPGDVLSFTPAEVKYIEGAFPEGTAPAIINGEFNFGNAPTKQKEKRQFSGCLPCLGACEFGGGSYGL